MFIRSAGSDRIHDQFNDDLIDGEGANDTLNGGRNDGQMQSDIGAKQPTTHHSHRTASLLSEAFFMHETASRNSYSVNSWNKTIS